MGLQKKSDTPKVPPGSHNPSVSTRIPTGDQSTEVTRDSIPTTVPSLDRYRILGELGSGGMGTVYKAVDRQLGREVAIKIPRQELMAIPEARSRFIREAEALATLNHPNICTVYDAGETNGVHYITMKLVLGPSLSEVTKQSQLTPHEAGKIVYKLAKALRKVHDSGILHRDIKPSNVMLEDGEPLLMDFGLARPQTDRASLTVSGEILGTPHYMSPEQAKGERATVASDIYCLGAVFYQLLAKRTPFTGVVPEVLYSVLHREPVAPSMIQREVPASLEAVCLKAMNKDPKKRFQSAGEFADGLENALAFNDPLPRHFRKPRWLRFRQSTSRSRILGLLVAMSCTIAV